MLTRLKNGILRWRMRLRHGHRGPAYDLARVGQMLAHAEQCLDITDAQRPAWNRFAAVVHDGVEALAAARTGDTGETATAARALAQLESAVEASSIVLRKTRAAFDALHTELDDAQRQRLDAMVAETGRGGRGRRHRRRHHAMWCRAANRA